MRTVPSTTRRVTGRRFASTAALIAALGASLVGPAALAAAPEQRQKVQSGSLTWGFKESFREYIEGPIADGGIEVTQPAVRLEDGTFRWSQGAGRVNAAHDTARLSFQGEVYFYGHDFGSGPQLEIWLEDPRVRIDGDVGTIIADVVSRDGAELVEYNDVELADLDFTGKSLDPNARNIVKANDIPSTLTEDGAEAFAGFYPAGQELDAVDFKVKVAP